MKSFLKRLGVLLLTLLIISFLSFAVFYLIPGNAALAKLGVNATPAQVEALTQTFGLDKPFFARYADWLMKALSGDFGYSFQYTNYSVSRLIGERLPASLLLAGLSFFLIILISPVFALWCAKKPGSLADRGILSIGQLSMAIPPFFLGILITFFLGLVLNLFQPGLFVDPRDSFWGSLSYLFFPALCVAIPKIAMTVRYLRSQILIESEKDYVRTARAIGNGQREVLFHHIFKNALIPVITFIGLVLSEILAGSIVAEQVFSVPGIGRLLISSIGARDYPVVQALVVYIASIVVLLSFLVDSLYRVLDPRTREASE